MKKGINFEKGEPNYDLFELACRVSAKRLFPNFVYIDAPQNIIYYKEGRPETEMAAMGCRTRTISNVNGDSITVGRGNFSFTTINLPRLGIDAKGDWDKFFTKLDYMMDLAKEQLESRYELISRKHVYNFPFAYGQHCVYGSENLAPNDEIKEALKNYSISIGFIGLAECMVAMTGHHHGEGKQYYDQALKIIQHMRERTDRYTEDTHMNWSLFATPAEGLSSRFTRIDKKRYGEIKGVTDRDYYTNSFHVPVYYDISAAKKMELEGPFHNLCNAGSITYVEANGDFTKNLEAFEDLVKYGLKCGLNYFAINHPVDSCPVCGYTGIIDDECPCCGFKDGDTEMDYDKLVELQRKGMLRNTVLREMSCGACHEQGETPE
jgi:ribonucleoside-triphosphate reductase